jgi:hypothetical protein
MNVRCTAAVTVNVGRAGAASLDVIQEVEYVKQEAKVVYLLECLQKTPPPVRIHVETVISRFFTVSYVYLIYRYWCSLRRRLKWMIFTCTCCSKEYRLSASMEAKVSSFTMTLHGFMLSKSN